MIRGSRFSLRSLELLLAGQMATRGPPLSAANGSGPAGDASAGPSHNGVGDAGLGNRIAAMERELQLLRRQVEDKERLRRQVGALWAPASAPASGPHSRVPLAP